MIKPLKDDLIAGLVVFLVAVPLCLGIALASNAPLLSGIVAGIIGGIVVGSISQSDISVSGPAAGMIAVVLGAITQLGSFENFLLALIFAGIIQIAVGALRAGFIADYIPGNVIQGLLCAIGILIVIKQLPLAFTHTEQHALLTDLLKDSAENLDFGSLWRIVHHINWGATFITIISIAMLIYSDHTRNRIMKKIPGPVLVVLMGVIINELYGYLIPSLTQTSAHLVNIPVNDSLKDLAKQLVFPNWHNWLAPKTYLYGFIIAAVGSLETLLNLEAAEKLDRKRKYCSRNRELFAQGTGNILSGLLGGLPITSVVVRSSVNIQAGAKTKFSTIFHGLLFIFTLLFISESLNLIPLASLAGILIYVGYKLTRVSVYRAMYRQGFMYYFPFLVTVITIVFTNILLGVLIGLACSIFFILKENSQMRFDIVEEHHPSGTIHRIILPQQLSFLRKAALIAELEAIPKSSRLIIDARYTKYIDNDILELIKEFAKKATYEKKIELNLIGFKNRYQMPDRINFINVTTYDVQEALTTPEIIQILREGNQRFVTDRRINRYFPSEVKATAKKQSPIAVVLSCIDSRVPVETVFDVGMGDLFIVRVAGNVVNDDVIGSIEFACHLANAKLILVLGHTRCGAIKAARDYRENGYIAKLLQKITPAVNQELQTAAPVELEEDEEQQLTKITELNVANSMATLYRSSSVIKELVDTQKVGLVSAMYDIRSGLVKFDLPTTTTICDHPER